MKICLTIAKDKKEHICPIVRDWLNKQGNSMQINKEIEYNLPDMKFLKKNIWENTAWYMYI